MNLFSSILSPKSRYYIGFDRRNRKHSMTQYRKPVFFGSGPDPKNYNKTSNSILKQGKLYHLKNLVKSRYRNGNISWSICHGTGGLGSRKNWQCNCKNSHSSQTGRKLNR